MSGVDVHPEAQDEIDAAIAWYEREWEGLGLEFLAEVDRAIARAAQQPDTWRGYAGIRDVRQLNVHRFPYSVIYRENGGHIRVLAVRGHLRDPEHGESRR